jgi:hypothetical protein
MFVTGTQDWTGTVTGTVVEIAGGNNTINIQQDDDADGATTATVDLGSTSGNALTVGVVDTGKGASGVNCTLTLEQASGSSSLVVDNVEVAHGGTLIVASATR